MPGITEAQLREMLDRCESATPGPWKSFIEGRDHDSGSDFIQTGNGDIELSGACVADQDFIAAARQDIPALVREVARLRNIQL